EKYKASNWSTFSTADVYTLAPGVISQIISKRNYVNGAKDYYYHYDAIGNVMFITDSYGDITASYVQEGFGNVIASSSGLVPNSYHLTTKELEHHPATGLYYFGARWYDPQVGRFITKTPFPPFIEHPYAFAENDPINMVDFNGQLAYFWHGYITFSAGLESGYGFWDSYKMGLGAAWVDFATMGEGNSAAAQNKHGMAGLLPDGKTFQTREQAIAATCEYIKKISANGDLAAGAHALQDLDTPLHAGNVLKTGLWQTPYHWYQDIFPSWSTIKKAYQDTKFYLQQQN
ncbi:MAG: RHS repeat-associated core domain-containing protein, partial [bacterium]|nr:RHS repeat-associated core domain-containing protein [bacterium]